MRKGIPALFAVCAVSALPAGPAQAGPGQSVTREQAATLGAQAYRYGFPLMEVLRVRAENTSVRAPDGHGNAPLNTFAHARRFATPADRTVVAPNVDTLYSLAQLDLGKGPIVLEHPKMGGRYFVFEFLDPYTNVIGYVGSRTTGSNAGRFALTWTKKPGRRVRGVRVIRSPYRRIWVIGRTLASSSSPSDMRKAGALMRRFALIPLSRLDNPPRPPSGSPGKATKVTVPEGLAFYDALGQAMADNPPPVRDRPFLFALAQVGVGPGLKPSSAGLPQAVLEGLRDGFAQAKAELPGATTAQALTWAALGGGWAIAPSAIGRYGTGYDFRAFIAQIGLGANTPEEAVYPVALTDSGGALFNGANRYRLTFPEQPPNRAFWSLTMYDISGFLVSNPQKRYAIGSSHPPLVKRANGSIVVAVQRTRPAERDVNWLSAPPAGFRLTLRIYRPRASVLSGAWKPPRVERAG